MKVQLALLVLAAVVFTAYCGEGGYGGGYGHYYGPPGFHHVHKGVESVYRNDLRQVHVNKVAEHYGSGTGTARWVGVPGTGKYFGYQHGYGGYGHGGHGY